MGPFLICYKYAKSSATVAPFGTHSEHRLRHPTLSRRPFPRESFRGDRCRQPIPALPRQSTQRAVPFRYERPGQAPRITDPVKGACVTHVEASTHTANEQGLFPLRARNSSRILVKLSSCSDWETTKPWSIVNILRPLTRRLLIPWPDFPNLHFLAALPNRLSSPWMVGTRDRSISM